MWNGRKSSRQRATAHCTHSWYNNVATVEELVRSRKTSHRHTIHGSWDSKGDWRPSFQRTSNNQKESCLSCLSLFNDSLKCICNYCVDGSICHFIFSKVVLAHISGEVGSLCTVLLSIYSRTCLPIFIEIGSYMTDREQKTNWHVFHWDTV